MCRVLELRHRICAHVQCHLPSTVCSAGFHSEPHPGNCNGGHLRIVFNGHSPVPYCDKCIRDMSDEIEDFYRPRLQRITEIGGPRVLRQYRALFKNREEDMRVLYDDVGGIEHWWDAHRQRREAEAEAEEQEPLNDPDDEVDAEDLQSSIVPTSQPEDENSSEAETEHEDEDEYGAGDGKHYYYNGIEEDVPAEDEDEYEAQDEEEEGEEDEDEEEEEEDDWHGSQRFGGRDDDSRFCV